MTRALLVVILAAPASATPQAMLATLEALRSQTVVDAASANKKEAASVKAGQSFDGNFTIQTLTPVEYATLDGTPRSAPPPSENEASRLPEPKPSAEPAKDPATITDGSGVDYYFEGTTPLNGITIYTPKKGDGSTSGGEGSPTDKYGTYGKIAVGVGAALAVAGLVAGGAWLAPLLGVAGLLIGAGAVLWFLFGRKK